MAIVYARLTFSSMTLKKPVYDAVAGASWPRLLDVAETASIFGLLPKGDLDTVASLHLVASRMVLANKSQRVEAAALAFES